jgi:hypothetical protein
MKYFLFAFSIGIMLLNCATSKKEWADFNKADCDKYIYGRIETKRLLTESDKTKLAQEGIQVQEFVFESQYLGSWQKKWAKSNLDKTVVKSLIPFTTQDKLASGMQIPDLKKLSESPGQSMVLVQMIATVNKEDLNQFGEIIFSRDHFYRMLVPHAQLMNLLEFPCLRLMSIVKDNYDPDQAY